MSVIWEEGFKKLKITMHSGECVTYTRGDVRFMTEGLHVIFMETGDMDVSDDFYPQGLIKEVGWETPRAYSGI